MLKEGYSEGRFYKCRNGSKAQIWKLGDSGDWIGRVVDGLSESWDGDGVIYDGAFHHGDNGYDILAEWKDEPEYIDTNDWHVIYKGNDDGRVESYGVRSSKESAIGWVKFSNMHKDGAREWYICPFNDRSKMERVQ